MVEVLLLTGTPREIIAEQILRVLREAGEPLSKNKIFEELRRRGVSTGENAVRTLLKTLEQEGRVKRITVKKKRRIITLWTVRK